MTWPATNLVHSYALGVVKTLYNDDMNFNMCRERVLKLMLDIWNLQSILSLLNMLLEIEVKSRINWVNVCIKYFVFYCVFELQPKLLNSVTSFLTIERNRATQGRTSLLRECERCYNHLKSSETNPKQCLGRAKTQHWQSSECISLAWWRTNRRGTVQIKSRHAGSNKKWLPV